VKRGARFVSVSTDLGDQNFLFIFSLYGLNFLSLATTTQFASNMKKLNLLLLLSGTTTAQFLSLPTSLTTIVGAAGVAVRCKSVPAGTCELNANVESYSGYADIPNTNQINLLLDVRGEKCQSSYCAVGGTA
jgi:hypothetical protein